MSKEFKPGDVIEIKKEDKKTIKTVGERCKTAQVAFTTASEMIKDSSKELFDLINFLYPELKDYRISFNHETSEINIIGKVANG